MEEETNKIENAQVVMEIVNPHAAGIDVGSRSHWVAVGQSEKDIREFGVFNQDLFEMTDWLHEKQVKTVAMESTGTYVSTPQTPYFPIEDTYLLLAKI